MRNFQYTFETRNAIIFLSFFNLHDCTLVKIETYVFVLPLLALINDELAVNRHFVL